MALRNLDRYKVEIAMIASVVGHALPEWERERIGDILENVHIDAVARGSKALLAARTHQEDQ